VAHLDTRSARTALFRGRSASAILVIALVVGVAAASASYLGGALRVPGPAEQASTEVMRERGAASFHEFCSWPKFEPRFWPECRGDADEWRARGASALVAHCTRTEPSRMFGADDCLSDDRPLFTLTGGPTPADAAAGGIAAAVAVAVLLSLNLAGRAVPQLRRRAT
jgi:hypothetical protein